MGLLGLDADDLAHLAQLEAEHGAMPATPTVASGKGKHFYLAYPDGMTLKNKAKFLGGLDLRTDDGYLIVPPSKHCNGQQYEWIVSPDTPLAPVPEWLLPHLPQKGKKPTQAPPQQGKGLTLRKEAEIDLSNHPGAEAGTQHDTLCSLIGKHIAGAEKEEHILALALAWAGRCSPPADEEKVRKIVVGCCRCYGRDDTDAQHGQGHLPADASALPAQDDDEDFPPLPPPPEWPTLNPQALHGLAGEIVEAMQPYTEADPVALLVTLLTCFGNAIGRSPRYAIEGDYHFANLFAVLVGKSGKGRKRVAEKRITSLWADDDAWKKDCHAEGLASGEGLIWHIRDGAEKTVATKENGKITGWSKQLDEAEPGVFDKRLLVIEEEFAKVLGVMQRQGNTLSPLIRQAWDSGNLRSMVKHDPTKCTGGHISIMGHITSEELLRTLDDTDAFNGFANRFLWCLVKRSQLLPDGGQGFGIIAHTLSKRLTHAVAVASAIGDMHRNSEAQALWHDLYCGALSAEHDGVYGSVVGRGEAQTLRLSMLYALLDGSAIITAEHLGAAYALWCYCDDSARIIYGEVQDSPEAKIGLKLLEHIKAKPGINLKALHGSLGNHVDKELLARSLAWLRDKGKAYPVPYKPEHGGRPGEGWHPGTANKLTNSEALAQAEPSLLVSSQPVKAKVEIEEIEGRTKSTANKRTNYYNKCVGVLLCYCLTFRQSATHLRTN